MPRPKPRIKAGPTLSHDNRDKMMACLLWWEGRDKSDPEYVKAPYYFDTILAWHDQLSLDDEERCATVHEVCVRPGWGERVAEEYAASLPPVQGWQQGGAGRVLRPYDAFAFRERRAANCIGAW